MNSLKLFGIPLHLGDLLSLEEALHVEVFAAYSHSDVECGCAHGVVLVIVDNERELPVLWVALHGPEKVEHLRDRLELGPADV